LQATFEPLLLRKDVLQMEGSMADQFVPFRPLVLAVTIDWVSYDLKE
jgi:hypothetical protein